MEEEGKRLLTVKETCLYLRISAPTLYRMLERDELMPVKIGKHTLFEKKDLDELIESAKRVPGKRKSRTAKKAVAPKETRKPAVKQQTGAPKTRTANVSEQEQAREEAFKKGEQGQLL